MLSTVICISQNDKLALKNRVFSIQQIDSICENDDVGKIIGVGSTGAEMKIESSNETKVIKGIDGFSYTIYPFHFDKTYYETLTNKEKNKYRFDKNSRLIKGEYHSDITYENSTGQGIKGEFYYYNDALFHVKIKLRKTDENKKDTVEVFDLSTTELNNSKSIENILSIDLKSWINNESNKIIEIYNRK